MVLGLNRVINMGTEVAVALTLWLNGKRHANRGGETVVLRGWLTETAAACSDGLKGHVLGTLTDDKKRLAMLLGMQNRVSRDPAAHTSSLPAETCR